MEQDARCTNKQVYVPSTTVSMVVETTQNQVVSSEVSKPVATEQPVEQQQAKTFLKRIAQGHMHNR